LSAFYYPPGVDASLVGRVRAEGIAIAGGLHPDAKTKYFRVGHMGAMKASDLLAVVGALERALAAGGHKVNLGAGLAAAQAALAG
jgi:alanine-glyoxylate transaminase/serine-glyoxylate transaminase/serine-pyruvate transaminase